jgi:hypothetical protein
MELIRDLPEGIPLRYLGLVCEDEVPLNLSEELIWGLVIFNKLSWLKNINNLKHKKHSQMTALRMSICMDIKQE